MTLHSAKFHLWATVAWATVGSGVTWWATMHYDEPPWVAVMSLYAIIVGHWGAYQGARAEEKAQDVQADTPTGGGSTKERLMSKSILLSKTLWANIVAMLAMILDEAELTNLIPDRFEGYMVAAIAVINIVLRVWTTQPVQMRMPRSTPQGLQ